MIDILHQKPLLGRQINWAHPLAQGLVGCWLFNENSRGNVYKIYDIISNTYNLVTNNPPVWTLGKFGSSILFDDANEEYLHVAATPVEQEPFTMSAWANCDQQTSNDVVFSLADKDDTNHRWAILFQGGAGNEIRAFCDSVAGVADTVNTYTINTWHHVCGIFANISSRTIYLDADITNKGINTNVRNVYENLGDRLSIGRHGDSTPGQWFSGKIDLPMLWNRALTEDEVEWIYREPTAMFQQNRVRWFSVGGVALTATIADTVGILDDLATVGTFIKVLADILGVTDTINTARNLKKAMADSVGITDVLSKIGTFIKSIADTVGTTDTITTSKGAIRSIADSLGITDILSKIGTYKRSVADTAGIADTTTTSKGVIRSIADSVGITDVLSALVIKVVSISDTLGITDTIATIVTAVISPFVDTISGISKIVKSISVKSGITKNQSKESKINKDTTGKSEL